MSDPSTSHPVLTARIAALEKELEEAKTEIGSPLEGSHPDEAKPRAETWHKERDNWRQEVGQLKFEIFNRKMELDQLNEQLTASREENAKKTKALEQLNDYFELGPTVFNVSNRFPFCVKVIKDALATGDGAKGKP